MDFRDYYIGSKYEINEDEELLKALKRQITFYLKESTFERFHGIWNKLFLLRKVIAKDKYYDVILNEMDNDEKKKFLKFILQEGQTFDINNCNDSVPKIWEHQLNNVKNKLKI